MPGYDHLQLGIDVTGADKGTADLNRLQEAMKKAGEVTVWTGKEAAAGLGAMAHGFADVTRESSAFIASHPLLIAGLTKITYSAAQHVSSVDQIANSYRGLRLAMSPTAFTAVTLGVGFAVEEFLRNAEKVAAANRTIALSAARTGMSFQNVLGMQTAGRIEGGDFSTVFAGKGASDVANLVEEYKKLADPMEKAAFAVEHFGANAEKAMPMLRQGIEDTTASAEKFAATVTQADRESLERLSVRMDLLSDGAHKLAASFREWWETETLGKRWFAMIAAHMSDAIANVPDNAPGAFGMASGASKYRPEMPTFGSVAAAKAKEVAINIAIAQMQTVDSGLLSRSDASMSAYDASQAGIQSKLSSAEDLRSKLRGQLSEARGGDLEASIRQRMLGNEQEIAGYKASIAAIEAKSQAVKDLEAAQKSLATFVEQMAQKEMGPVSRTLEQGAAWFRGTPGATSAMGASAMSAARVAAGGELQKLEAEDAKQSFKVASESAKISGEEWAAVYKTLNHVSEIAAKDFTEAAKQAAQVADEIDRIKTGEARSETAGQSGRTLNLASILMGPGQEGAAITFAYRERIRLANELYNFEIDHAHTLVEQEHAEADWRKGMFDAEVEHELKIAELQRKRLDERRAMGSEIFDAMLGGADGMKQFGLNFIKGQARTIAGNAFAELTKNTSLNLGLPGKIFQGTMFGADPLKGATDANTMATVDNTIELRALRTAAMSPSGGGGGFSAAGSTWARAAAAGGLFANMPGTYAPGADAGNTTYNPSLMSTAGYGTPEFDAQGNAVTVDSPSSAGGGGGGGFGWGKVAGGVGVGMGVYGAATSPSTKGKLASGGGALIGAGAMIGFTPVGWGLMIAGAAMEVASMFITDPKQQRATDLALAAQQRSYTMPSGADYSMDSSGRYSDYNYRGQTRTGNTYNIYAMDSSTMVDYFNAHPTILPTGLATSIAGGNADDVVGLLSARTN